MKTSDANMYLCPFLGKQCVNIECMFWEDNTLKNLATGKPTKNQYGYCLIARFVVIP